MSRDLEAEWQIDASEYPASGTDAERLRFLVRYAILAPSGHNTQPGCFALRLIAWSCSLIAGGRFPLSTRTIVPW
jgi:hypothetical protein